MYKIDLHGHNVEQAIGKLTSTIYLAELNGHDVIEIVAGKGTGAMQVTVEEFLSSGGYDFERQRDGVYVVYIAKTRLEDWNIQDIIEN